MKAKRVVRREKLLQSLLVSPWRGKGEMPGDALRSEFGDGAAAHDAKRRRG